MSLHALGVSGGNLGSSGLSEGDQRISSLQDLRLTGEGRGREGGRKKNPFDTALVAS